MQTGFNIFVSMVIGYFALSYCITLAANEVHDSNKAQVNQLNDIPSLVSGC